MKSYRKELWFEARTRRAYINITPQVEECLRSSGVREGLVLAESIVKSEPQVVVVWEPGQELKVATNTIEGIAGLPTGQADLLRFHDIETAPGQQQVPHHRIPQIPLQARNSAESRYQSQSQLRKTEPRHTIRDNDVAHQRQLKPAAKRDPMHRRNRRQGSRVQRVHHAMDAAQKFPHSAHGFGLLHSA